ncbi:hypothetical protein [Plantibacter sp. YIM 135347]|uniref:hypothetical protein n=1 Tax=Plantibacter sp. YIM 135347 TaxID=3423919 RepID=UPI003D341F17
MAHAVTSLAESSRVLHELEVERELLGSLLAALPAADPGVFQLREQIARTESALDARNGEQQLALVTGTLRQLIRRNANEHTSTSRISPLANEAIELGGGSRVDYSYERSMTAEPLESRLIACANSLENRPPAAVAFSSGMAALSTVLELAIYEFFARHARRPHVATLVDYFETGMLVELQRASCNTVTVATSPATLLEAKADIVVLESLRYNWDLDVVPFDELADAWSDERDAPSVVIVDSTLTAGSWPVTPFLASISPATQVIDVRSGLKLDQQGLELSNLGIALVHQSNETRSFGEFAQLLRTARSVTGAGLSASALSALRPAFLFDAPWSHLHVGSVALNNADFAASVRTENVLFERIASPLPLASMSPFTVLTLEDDRIENYELLLGIIREETERRRLLLQFGASFGFRGHRYETIIPAKQDLTCLFKVALGSRRGPSFWGTLELFTELATYSNISALRRAYPNTSPARLSI